ncbi:hypothetical protein GG344DRAFT_80710 [Lentinula edodes]|nr:hypothetical protein GG344DRAFT_80710 [Lentinula edodes]
MVLSSRPVVSEQLNDFSADFSRICKHYDDETPPVDIPVQEDIREYKLKNIAAVWNFVRALLRVQLRATRSSPLTTTLSFHSTCVMNILTHDAAYCLFPKLTLEHRALLLIDLTLPMMEVQAAAVNKYSQRGFEIMSNAPTGWMCNPNSALTFLRPRFIGDHHCYKIDFENLSEGAAQGNFIKANSWGMAYLRRFNSVTFTDVDMVSSVPYIAYTGDIIDIERHLHAVNGLIEQQLLRVFASNETALLTIQTLISRSARRPHPASFPWHALTSVIHIIRGHSVFYFPSTVAQMLYEFFCIIDKTSSSCPSPVSPGLAPYVGTGIRVKILMIFQTSNNWLNVRGVPTHADIVMSFKVYSSGDIGIYDISFLLCNIYQSFFANEEPRFQICALLFNVDGNYSVGFAAFTGVSARWIQRAETTPTFDIVPGLTETFVTT